MNKGQFPDGYISVGEMNPNKSTTAAYDPESGQFTDVIFSEDMD